MVALAATASLALSACGGGNDNDGAGEAVDGGTYSYYVDIEANGGMSFDPAAMQQGQYTSTYPVTNSWLKQDARGVFMPDLAESVDVVDPSTITVKMREGLEFSNGETLDAETAIASIERTTKANPPGLRVSGGLDLIESMKADSTTQFTVKLNAPKAGMVYPLFADAETTPVAPASMEGTHAQDVVTAGPFMIEEYRPGDKVVLVKNPNYWDAESVRLGRVEVLHAAGTAAMVSGLRAGQGDFAPTLLETDTHGLPDNLVGSSRPLSAAYYMSMCIDDGNPLGDIKIRQALSHATDKEAVNERLYGGKSEPAYSMVPQGDPIYDPSLEDEFPYDVAKAKELLAEAGYPDGFEATAIVTPGDGTKLAEIVQAQWQEVGVTLKIKPTTNQVEDWFLGGGAKGTVGTVPAQRPLMEILPRFFTSDAFANVCKQPVPKLDECADRWAALAPDDPAYVTTGQECQRLVKSEYLSGVGTAFVLQNSIISDRVVDAAYQMTPILTLMPDVTKIAVTS